MLVVDSAWPSEVSEVVRIAADSLVDLDPEHFAYACSRDTCVVARESRSGRVLGFAVAKRQEPCEGHILALAVDRMHRGEGIGSALLHGVKDAMVRSGAYRLSLEVRADNGAAQEFYARNGFRPEGLHPRAFPDGEDAVWYGKSIQ